MGAITPEALAAQIRAGTAPCVVDVRSKLEFDEGHVPAAIHIPFWQMTKRWRELPVARDAAVVVYCGHGPRAYIAGSVLKRRGFTRVMYLTGHMTKWTQLNLPLEGK
jgi:rhodanese-related sulfurtransferase